MDEEEIKRTLHNCGLIYYPEKGEKMEESKLRDLMFEWVMVATICFAIGCAIIFCIGVLTIVQHLRWI